LLKKHYTLISTGTELACLSGLESWYVMPRVPGYTSVCEIVKKGDGVEKFNIGDIVFCYGNHSLYQIMKVQGVFLPIPSGIEKKYVPFARMASVAATAIRNSTIEWGDYVAITGQALVGNMAMQLAKVQGAKVIAIDILDEKLEYSKQCGADLVINSAKENAMEKIKEFTNGEMVSTVIDATGIPAVPIEAVQYISKGGELILLGSPRGKYETDAVPFLAKSHISSSDVTIKGAHEWRYPIAANPFLKHSIERNTRKIFDLMAEDRIVYKPLLTDIVSPADCFELYKKLNSNKERYMGILYDWSKV
jgi:2-desacetyl-2-hydroxyethyl bacteriochlorophyllide A dehydrogenase